MVEIYCDGGARFNGTDHSIAGFGVCALVQDQSHKSGFRIDFTYNKQYNGATNNQMELKALLYALKLAASRYKNDICYIKCDSSYCVNTYNDWMHHWYHNGWVRYHDEEVKNLDIVKELFYFKTGSPHPNIIVEKVRGHSGIIGNELADALAHNDEAKIKEIFKMNGQNPIL